MKRLSFLILSLVAAAAFADPKADPIVKALLDKKSPNDMTAVSTMTITDQSGVVKVRELKAVSKETAEGTKGFTEFVKPADVTGTKFLSVSKKGLDTDQRIYLPALKKVRKISSSSKDGDFMGSDLNYFDMEKRYFEDGTYTLVSENETLDSVPGKKLVKISTVYKDPNCPYSKVITWVDPVALLTFKTDCYDKKDGLILKTMTINEYTAVKGYTMAAKTTVVNHKKGSKTVMTMSNIVVDAGVKDSEVSVKRLEQ